VVFDPRRDLAVLSVPGLPAPPMKVGKDLNRADSAVVAGFPLDGPFRLAPARVRGIITARGADIRGNPGVSRQVYSLAAKVQPGNSGGPLLAPSGEVVGTVFARSIEDTDTGYALTMQESARVLKKAGSANVPVDTGACVSR
jgi:S1-C subfamily serine protease